MPSVTCRNVQHTQQQYDWDCGLSCVLMALDAADELDAKDSILENLEEVCKSEGFGHSTWTIDLCYLLKHYAPRLAFSYTTITLGVDPSYMNQVGFILFNFFYSFYSLMKLVVIFNRFLKKGTNDPQNVDLCFWYENHLTNPSQYYLLIYP